MFGPGYERCAFYRSHFFAMFLWQVWIFKITIAIIQIGGTLAKPLLLSTKDGIQVRARNFFSFFSADFSILADPTATTIFCCVANASHRGAAIKGLVVPADVPKLAVLQTTHHRRRLRSRLNVIRCTKNGFWVDFAKHRRCGALKLAYLYDPSGQVRLEKLNLVL